MNIGIKYCGGCNSQYDRVKLIKSFKEKHPENRYSDVLDGELTQDIWIIVCGCPCACVCTDGLAAKLNLFFVKSPEDIPLLEAEIENLKRVKNLDKKEV